jgi:Protein of unknown function (DUF4232)
VLKRSSGAAARAAVTAVLLGSLTVLSACATGGTAAPPTVTVTEASGGGSSPAPATSTSGASSSAPGTPECATASLRIGVSGGNGAAGTIYYNLGFTNVSGSPCVVQGYPGISLVSAPSGTGKQIGAPAKRAATTASRLITVNPGQTAHAELGIADAGNFPASSCHPVTAHYLKVFPPDQTAAAYLSFTIQTCASASVATMHIAPLTAKAAA